MTKPMFSLYTDATLLCIDAESISQIALDKANIKQDQLRHLVSNRPVSIRAHDYFSSLETIRAPAVEIYDGVSLPRLSTIEGNVSLSGLVQLPRLLNVVGNLTIHHGVGVIPRLTMVDGSLSCCMGPRLPRLTTITGNYMPTTISNAPGLLRIGRSLGRSHLVPRTDEEGMGASVNQLVGIDASRALGYEDVAREKLALDAHEHASILGAEGSEEPRWGLNL